MVEWRDLYLNKDDGWGKKNGLSMKDFSHEQKEKWMSKQ